MAAFPVGYDPSTEYRLNFPNNSSVESYCKHIGPNESFGRLFEKNGLTDKDQCDNNTMRFGVKKSSFVDCQLESDNGLSISIDKGTREIILNIFDEINSENEIDVEMSSYLLERLVRLIQEIANKREKINKIECGEYYIEKPFPEFNHLTYNLCSPEDNMENDPELVRLAKKNITNEIDKAIDSYCTVKNLVVSRFKESGKKSIVQIYKPSIVRYDSSKELNISGYEWGSEYDDYNSECDWDAIVEFNRDIHRV